MPIVKDGLIFCCNLKYVAPHLSIPDRSERWATVGIAISWLVDIGWLVGWYSHWLVGWLVLASSSELSWKTTVRKVTSAAHCHANATLVVNLPSRSLHPYSSCTILFLKLAP